jgi:hypothetical protein
MSTPAASAKFSPARWTWLPTPADAKLIVPGRALAAPIRSFRVLCGEASCTTTSIGPCATLVIGSRSFLVSKGIFLYSAGLIVTEPDAISSV